MKRIAQILLLALALVFAQMSPAYAHDHNLSGVTVNVVNTIESQAFDFPTETEFGKQGPAVVGAGMEFAECCDGFYNIDLTGNLITMQWVGPDSFERVIEPGTFDRYYFTFSEPVLAGAFLSPQATLPVNVTVMSPTELRVEVGPGMEIGDGFDAVISVSTLAPGATSGSTAGTADTGTAELAFTGTTTTPLAIGGTLAIAVGAALVAWSRDPRETIEEG